MPATDEKAPQTESKSNTGGDIDRVQMASRLPDGSPHQTPGFEFIGDETIVENAAKQQLREQAVSAVDSKLRTAAAAPAEDNEKRDKDTQELIDAHEKAAKQAESRASSDVKAHIAK